VGGARVRFTLDRAAFLRQYRTRTRTRRLMMGAYGLGLLALGAIVATYSRVGGLGAVAGLVLLAWTAWLPRRAWAKNERAGGRDGSAVLIEAGELGVRMHTPSVDAVLAWSRFKPTKRRPDALWLELTNGAAVLIERAQVTEGDLDGLADAIDVGARGGSVRGRVAVDVAPTDAPTVEVTLRPLSKAAYGWSVFRAFLLRRALATSASIVLFGFIADYFAGSLLWLSAPALLALAWVVVFARTLASVRQRPVTDQVRVAVVGDQLRVDPMFVGPAVFPLRTLKRVRPTRGGWELRFEGVVVPLSRARVVSGDLDALVDAARSIHRS
jgi:hypothetical protein